MRFLFLVGALLLPVEAFLQTPPPSTPRTATPPATQSRAYDEAVAKARELLRANNASAALSASQAAIALDDKRWEAYVTAAGAYSAQLLFDDAIGMLQAALARAPEDRKPMIRDALASARSTVPAPQLQARPNNVPSLKETLEWLSENIPLAGRWTRVIRASSGSDLPTEHTALFSADGCTITAGHSEVDRFDDGRLYSVTMETYVVPLSAAEHVRVAPRLWRSKRSTLASGPVKTYEVIMDTSVDSVSVTSVVEGLRKPREETREKGNIALIVDTDDETLADRIANAVRNAIELCRVKR